MKETPNNQDNPGSSNSYNKPEVVELSKALQQCSTKLQRPSRTSSPLERMRHAAQGKRRDGEPDYFRFDLPSEAQFLACFYSEILDARPLEAPLSRFLVGASDTPDVEALALTVWQAASPYSFSVYVLGDFRWQYRRADESSLLDAHGMEDARAAHLRLYRSFSSLKKLTRAEVPHIACNLWFMNTHGKDVEQVFPTLREDLLNDDNYDLHPGNSLIHISFARVLGKHPGVTSF